MFWFLFIKIERGKKKKKTGKGKGKENLTFFTFYHVPGSGASDNTRTMGCAAPQSLQLSRMLKVSK
jgi:hypothetical protein